jgi:hypothetical protein
MTRHGMIQRSTAGAQPAATDPHASMAINEANRAAPGRPPCQQHRAESQRSDLCASIAALLGDGHVIRDTSRESKSP